MIRIGEYNYDEEDNFIDYIDFVKYYTNEYLFGK